MIKPIQLKHHHSKKALFSMMKEVTSANKAFATLEKMDVVVTRRKCPERYMKLQSKHKPGESRAKFISLFKNGIKRIFVKKYRNVSYLRVSKRTFGT